MHFMLVFLILLILLTWRTLWDIKKSSSAAGRTRRRLGNTSTCPYGAFRNITWWLCYMSKRTIWTSARVAKPTSSGSCSWWWLCYILKRYLKNAFVKFWKNIFFNGDMLQVFGTPCCFSSRPFSKQLAPHVSTDTLQLKFPGMTFFLFHPGNWKVWW